MKKLLLLFISCFLMIQTSKAQNKISTFHLGAFTGISTYSGDLLEKSSDQIAESHPAFGAYLRYSYGEYLSAKAGVTYGFASGSDLNAEHNLRRLRNLSFRSPILEFSVIPEFNTYDFVLPASGYVLTPFIFVGVGGFWFNPQASYNGQWLDLQPLGTEGQGLSGYPQKYNRFALSIPHGIGLKFKMSELTTLTWEFGNRFTNTDYIDDLGGFYPDAEVLAEGNGLIAAALSDRTPEYTGLPSTREAGTVRASSQSKDFFLFSGFSLSVNLAPKSGLKP